MQFCLRPEANHLQSNRLQIRIRHHQPLRASVFEVDLHARVGAGAFCVQHHANAETRMGNVTHKGTEVVI